MEMLVVISIIVVLAGLMIPGISNSLKIAKRTKVSGQLRNIGTGLNAYMGDNGGRYPNLYSGGLNAWQSPLWTDLITDYVQKPVYGAVSPNLATSPTFISPFVNNKCHHPASDFGGNTQAFTYSGYISPSFSSISNPSEFAIVMMAGNKGGNGVMNGVWYAEGLYYSQDVSRTKCIPWDQDSGKILMLFADGHVCALSKKELNDNARAYLLAKP